MVLLTVYGALMGPFLLQYVLSRSRRIKKRSASMTIAVAEADLLMTLFGVCEMVKHLKILEKAGIFPFKSKATLRSMFTFL
ncbi:hypothetical protein C0674_12165 [Sporolactobacillus terrae]|uniref:Uncharacterized protein n=1 Tax=Sporolactobacillus terrae TaxID=269673 RepID=A0ABX5Q9F1_9BACL|nr:hypothetical protein C0674_12165 [Sporolactobacillus terrae]QAA26270.1 hypothetical protein C0679_12150 [Sporolactobacillus terrae]